MRSTDRNRVDRRRQHVTALLDAQRRPHLPQLGADVIQLRPAAGLDKLHPGGVDLGGALLEPGHIHLSADHADQVRVPVGGDLRLCRLDAGERDLVLVSGGGGFGDELVPLDPREEEILDVRVQGGHRHAGRFGADAGGVALRAVVPGVASAAVSVGDHAVPARGAADDPGQQRALSSAAALFLEHRIGRLELGAGDERLVRVGARVVADVDLAEVGAPLDQIGQRLGAPVAALLARHPNVEPVAELVPRVAARSSSEDLADDRRGLRVGLEAPVILLRVAERCAAGEVDAAGQGAVSGGAPVLADAVEFELGHREHHRACESADRRGGVEAVSDADQRSAGVVEALHRDSGVRDGAREPVERRNDDPVGLPCLDGFDRCLEFGAAVAASGLVEVFADVNDDVAVGGGELLAFLPLYAGADEAVALAASDAGDADVGDEAQAQESMREWGLSVVSYLRVGDNTPFVEAACSGVAS